MKRPAHESIASLDPESAAYADLVAGRLKTILGHNLVGVYLHGSAVLGDFSRERSDIDILAVSHHDLSPQEKRAIADQLSSASLPYPVGGELEFHVVDREGLSGSLDAPPFELRARSHIEEPALVDAAIEHRRGQTEVHPDGPLKRTRTNRTFSRRSNGGELVRGLKELP